MSKNQWLALSSVISFVVYSVLLISLTPGSSRAEFMAFMAANPLLGLVLTLLLLYSIAALVLSFVILLGKKIFG